MNTSLQWREYFERNARSLLDIPWGVGGDLGDDERAAIASSLQGFQAGESSEGRNLFRYAGEYANESGDHEYVAVIRLFIAEEQRHAGDLAKFLQLNGIPLLKKTFPDRVFRRLRHIFGSLEISIGVLITAEIIAKVYYAVLKDATDSRILRPLCDQILRDEIKHVEFQAEQLGVLRRGRTRIFGWITMAMQRFLFWGTCLIVWQFHKKAIRKGGFNFRMFWRSSWSEFNDAFATS